MTPELKQRTVSNDTQVKQDVDRREVLKVINTQVLASHNLNVDPCNFVINQNSLADALLDLLATVRREVFKESMKIIDDAGKEWGDQARARKSKTYSAYVIAALDLKGRIEAALEASATKKGEMNADIS